MGDCAANGQEISLPFWYPSVWEDLRIPVTATTRGGSKDPPFLLCRDNGAGSQGVFSYHFSNLQEEELYFACQIPHAWDEGTEIRPHVHWSATTAAAGTVRWGLEYSISRIGTVFPNTTLIYINQATVGAAWSQQVAAFSAIAMTTQTISTMLLCRIFRDPLHAADTYGAPAALFELDFHYQRDSAGSRTEYIK